jgi:hypothetical protein
VIRRKENMKKMDHRTEERTRRWEETEGEIGVTEEMKEKSP